ncbi:hypothetical protein IAD21_03571 [Abditibacteriota bacterium]|nr:hypothetical protein IAD21_03571 [Abditibacteriota bacterium]
MASRISKITRLPIRAAFPHEAHDFTVWLQDNLDVLNGVLGTSLIGAEREQHTSNFRVDLVAEDDAGRRFVIENQFGGSDHDHLGKLLTYLVAFSAAAAIWIVEDPRPEHVGVVNWLNESSDAEFYLVKVEAICIDDSSAAPLLTRIVGPSEETRAVARTKQDLSQKADENDSLRYEFWKKLLTLAKTRSLLHASISPSSSSFVGTSSGGLCFLYAIGNHHTMISFYIDRGRDHIETNKRIFDHVFAHKEEIESRFGDELVWQRLSEKQASRVNYRINQGGLLDSDKWDAVIEATVDAMSRFHAALKPAIDSLPAFSSRSKSGGEPSQ